MNELERELRELDVAWPATPDLATAVTLRIAVEPRADAAPRRRAPWRRLPAFGAGWRSRLAYVAAVLALLFGGTMAVSPQARSTVLRWLGLKSVEIKRAPLPQGIGRELNLGTRIALPPGARVPAALGEPDAVYATSLPDGTRATTLLYAGPPLVLVQTFRASVTPFIQKTIREDTDLEQLTIDGAQAYWITGAHGFAFQSPNGVVFEDQRLSDRVLLVERDGLLIRVEGALSRERAIAIARSIK